jgi:hypothetical protein
MFKENAMGMIVLKNESTGVQRTVKQGFSWTIFFFGGLALLFRGQFKQFVILLILSFLLVIPGIIYWIVLCFTANRDRLDDLAQKGYKKAVH